MASVTPVNLGVYEARAVVAYGLVGLEPGLAIGSTVTRHATYLVPMSGIVWMMMASKRGRAMRRLPRESLLRTSCMATHEPEHLECVLEAFRSVGREFGLI